MSMKKSSISIVGFLASMLAGEARADLIITIGRSDLQPDENLLFNLASLNEQGITVQGATNNTHTVINITGNETLITPSNGQARVDAVDTELNFALIDAMAANIFFSEFEANLHVGGPISGTFTVLACTQFNVCETATFNLGSGQNTFQIAALDGQLINTVQISTSVDVDDIRQIRLGGIQQVAEPGTLGLMALGLAGVMTFWRMAR